MKLQLTLLLLVSLVCLTKSAVNNNDGDLIPIPKDKSFDYEDDEVINYDEEGDFDHYDEDDLADFGIVLKNKPKSSKNKKKNKKVLKGNQHTFIGCYNLSYLMQFLTMGMLWVPLTVIDASRGIL